MINRNVSCVVTLAMLAPLTDGRCAEAQPEPAQKGGKVAVKFKLFDTNNPQAEKPLQPRPVALLSVRDQTTKLPAFPTEVKVEDAGDGFSQVLIDKDLLIEHLVIEVVGTRYSPADVTKVVTRAPITIYPGVSDSTDQFSFSAFGAQMNSYKAIITDLNTALPGRREDIRRLLGGKFKTQLENMQRATTDRARLLTTDPQEIAAAEKLAKETLVLYGLAAEEKAEDKAAPPTVIYVPVYIHVPIYCPPPPVRYRGCFGRK